VSLTRRDLFRRLAGAAVAATVAPAVVEAAKPALVDACSSASMKVGDVFTIAGKYAMNPITGKATGHLQQFVVRAEVTGRRP
jgi:hypothetical protein